MQSVAVWAVALLACLVAAQDPAPSWLAWGAASCGAGQQITRFEASFRVPPLPAGGGPPYTSYWIGIGEPTLCC